MKRIFLLILSVFLLISCSDGGISEEKQNTKKAYTWDEAQEIKAAQDDGNFRYIHLRNDTDEEIQVYVREGWPYEMSDKDDQQALALLTYTTLKSKEMIKLKLDKTKEHNFVYNTQKRVEQGLGYDIGYFPKIKNIRFDYLIGQPSCTCKYLVGFHRDDDDGTYHIY